jgi:hypothetical protein
MGNATYASNPARRSIGARGDGKIRPVCGAAPRSFCIHEVAWPEPAACTRR